MNIIQKNRLFRVLMNLVKLASNRFVNEILIQLCSRRNNSEEIWMQYEKECALRFFWCLSRFKSFIISNLLINRSNHSNSMFSSIVFVRHLEFTFQSIEQQKFRNINRLRSMKHQINENLNHLKCNHFARLNKNTSSQQIFIILIKIFASKRRWQTRKNTIRLNYELNCSNRSNHLENSNLAFSAANSIRHHEFIFQSIKMQEFRILRSRQILRHWSNQESKIALQLID